MTGPAAPHPLDNPVRSSLCGPHAHFAQRRGGVLRYPADVSPFAALPDRPRAADWADLAALAGPGAMVALAGVAPPDGWPVTPIGEGVQLVHEGVVAGEGAGEGAGDDDEIVRRSSRWPGSACTRRAGPRSAGSARTTGGAAMDSRPA